MRELLLAAVLFSGGCQDVTDLQPDRVPPPDREEIDDGHLGDTTDPCGALDVEPAQRLSATSGDSDGMRMALLRRSGREAWVAVAWIEHGTSSVEIEIRLADGVPFVDPRQFDFRVPTAIQLAAVPGQDEFVLIVDRENVESAVLIIGTVGELEGRSSVPSVSRTSVVARADRILVAGIATEGGDGPRRVGMNARPVTPESAFAPEPMWLDGARAETVVLATAGPDTWLAWSDGEELYASVLVEGQSQWTAESPQPWGSAVSGLRRAQGAQDLTVGFVDASDLIQAYRFDRTGWQAVASPWMPDPPGIEMAITRGESGARWAMARAVQPQGQIAPEIRIERFQQLMPPCFDGLACVTITTDELPSSDPEIVGVGGGYLVGWSDRIGDQKDEFLSFARCRPTATPIE